MADLSEFLLARIAEDEAAASEAGADSWEVADDRKVRWVRNGDNASGWAAFADLPTAAEHIARHHPARILAECEAKRRIVELMLDWPERDVEHWALYDALQLLALPYAEHPDYRDEWRP